MKLSKNNLLVRYYVWFYNGTYPQTLLDIATSLFATVVGIILYLLTIGFMYVVLNHFKLVDNYYWFVVGFTTVLLVGIKVAKKLTDTEIEIK